MLVYFKMYLNVLKFFKKIDKINYLLLQSLYLIELNKNI